MILQPIDSNLFELHRGGTRITYSAGGIDGRAHLHFEEGERQLDFAGDQIEEVDTRVGRLVTVELSFVADGSSEALCLLIPHVNLDSGGGDASCKTVAVRTTLRSRLAGPSGVAGQVESYSAKTVRGTARVVNF
ncbi:MAG TPA: hypothetical protein VOA87_07310 [Thermoanaerobaculia bacterium]|nr:hypothetical protein [Thermoanaerobaculia bacterium]